MSPASVSGLGSAKKRTTLGAGSDDADVNPFQVYPVLGLSDVKDIQSITVSTKEIQDVQREVFAYAHAFDARTEPPAKLLLAARGDFGTGKTHLMLYARSVLASEREKAEQARDLAEQPPRSEPRSPGESLAPVVALAVSSEAPIEEWYATELGPALIEVASPRELVRELLTRIACDVANAEQDPELRELAHEFRRSRKALYQAFRNPGAFDVSAVDERFGKEIEAACPRTSRAFRRAIAALRWEETADLAEDWLAGNELPADEMLRLGVRPGELATRAANMICVTASLCRRLNRPFGLFIDEFEHLTRFDAQSRSKRNITWIKRLVESLARRGAIVFICGHWEAWDQKGDFLDRFVGGRPLQLVRLNADDVLKVVAARAGEKAWEGFTMETARSVVEETAGNIRRVMTVLYDLWSDESLGSADVVTAECVKQAAYRRLQPGSEAGILPTIERAIKGGDAQVRRDEKVGSPPEEVDMTARLDGELRLIVRVVHARDELALLDGGTKFASLVKAARTMHPAARGLCVTLGAVIDKHVLALDAAYPETDLVNGESADAIEQLPKLVVKALARAPEAISNPDALVALGETRSGAILRADVQSARAKEIIGAADGRSEAVSQAVSADPIELANLKAEQARIDSYRLIMDDAERPVRQQFLAAAPRSGPITASFGLVFLIWAASGALKLWSEGAPTTQYLSDFQVYLLKNLSFLTWMLSLSGAFIALIGVWLCWRLYMDLGEYRRYHLQIMRRKFAEGDSTYMLDQMNRLFERELVGYGPRRGQLHVIAELEARASRIAAAGAPSDALPSPAFPIPMERGARSDGATAT